jgi:hypothetical protein
MQLNSDNSKKNFTFCLTFRCEIVKDEGMIEAETAIAEPPTTIGTLEGMGKDGRFLPGNRLTPKGSEHWAIKRSTRWRAKFAKAVTDEDFDKAVKVLLKCVREGQKWAVLEFFDRTMGKVTQPLEFPNSDGNSFAAVLSSSLLASLQGQSRSILGLALADGQHAKMIENQAVSSEIPKTDAPGSSQFNDQDALRTAVPAAPVVPE